MVSLIMFTAILMGTVLCIISVIIIKKLVDKAMGRIFMNPIIQKMVKTTTKKVAKNTIEKLNKYTK